MSKKEKVRKCSSLKVQKIKRNILQKIHFLKNKINTSEDNFIMINQLNRLQEKLKIISMSPKEKNRYKEIKRINSRIKELEVEVKIFNNSIHSEHIKKLKLHTKIHKLIKRKNILENQVFLRKNVRRTPSLIRFQSRRTVDIGSIICVYS
tara:strand:- start:305 stop:754 length:450 start_codon:yes stop_codon:yes gene_type:complete